MEGHGANPRKRHNEFNKYVDKQLRYPSSGSNVADVDHGQKKLKLNSEAPLSTLDQPFPIPNLLLSAFKDSTAGSTVKFQLFVSKSYSPSNSTSPQPAYILKVTSGSSNSSGEFEPAGNVNVDGGGTTPVLTETRLVAEGQFLLRSRL